MKPYCELDTTRPLCVTALRCGRCRGRLDWLSRDNVFTCATCQLGTSIQNGRKKEFPILFAVPDKRTEREIFYLPIWELVVRISIGNGDHRKDVRTRRLEEIERVFVPGFDTRNNQIYGDIGLLYTESRVRIERDIGDVPRRVVGITRGPDQAEKYGTVLVNMLVDKRIDVTDLEIALNVQDKRIWAVPFQEDSANIKDCLIGKSFPAHFVENIQEIRSWKVG